MHFQPSNTATHVKSSTNLQLKKILQVQHPQQLSESQKPYVKKKNQSVPNIKQFFNISKNITTNNL